MSMFGFGRPQPSSAEKIAAAEQEMDLVTDMFNKYASIPFHPFF
jgi:import inner membrane translocase subunit TIM10